MASQVLRVGYRPLRIGFLIRTDNIEDLLLAVRLNTLLWGGVYNPLIPVGEAPHLVGRLIAAFNVDVLHPVADSDQVREVLRSHRHLSWPHALPNASGFFEEVEGRLELRAVDVLHWIGRNRPEDGKSPYYLIRWNEADPLAPLLACMFGQFPEKEQFRLLLDYERTFIQGLLAQDAPISQGQPVHDFLYNRVGPAGFTAVHLESQGFTSLWDRGIYIGEPDFRNLVNYWNIRASGADCVFHPLGYEARLWPYVREHLRRVIEWVSRQTGAHRFISVWRERDQNIPEEISREIPGGAQILTISVENGPDFRLPLFGKEPQSIVANLDTPAERGPSLAISLPTELRLEDMPFERRRQQWVVSVSPLTESGYEGYTLQLPFIPALNRWYSHQIVVMPHGLRVQPEGIGAIQELWDQTLELWPIEARSLILKVLEHAGFQTTPSVAGRIAQQLIVQMRGLEGCRVFKIPGVRKLIATKNARDGITRSTALQTIFDKNEPDKNSFERFKSLVIASSETSGTPDLTFNYLLRQGVFRPGLRFDCPRCTLSFWVSLGSLGERCSCEYCGYEFPVAPFLKNRGDWQFRLTGLFGREGGDEGAVPVVLTLLQLLRIHSSSDSFLYTIGTELEAEDGKCEVDIVVLERSRGETHLLLGECKTSNEITENDVANLLRVHRRVSRLGIECHLLFAKATEHFADAEIERFKGLSKDHVWPILFTTAELEPYEPYGEVEDEALPRGHPYDFRDLALNSEWLYLRTTD